MDKEDFIGTVEESYSEDNKIFTIFRIPALSSSMARRRARMNAKIKGLNNIEITGVENLGEARLPGQKEFDVKVESRR